MTIKLKLKKTYKKIKSYLKRFRLFIGHFILDKKPIKDWDQSLLPNSKILFIRHDGKIGDFIVSSFVYREIKKQYPNIHIGVVVAKETYFLFKTNPYIDSLYVIPKYSFYSFFKVGKKIANDKYDIIIDLTDVLRNRDLILIRTAKAAINIGHNQNHLKLFNKNIRYENKHITKDYERALMALGFNAMNRNCEFPDITVSKNLSKFIQKYLINSYIVINFFGAANHKKFSKEKQIEWIIKLRKSYKDKIILVLTYPSITNELKSYLPEGEYIMYEKTQTILDSIELIKHASLVITPDTSIIHIASAFNKNIIGFYADKNPLNPYKKWFPMNDSNSKIYYYKDNINEIDISNVLNLH